MVFLTQQHLFQIQIITGMDTGLCFCYLNILCDMNPRLDNCFVRTVHCFGISLWEKEFSPLTAVDPICALMLIVQKKE